MFPGSLESEQNRIPFPGPGVQRLPGLGHEGSVQYPAHMARSERYRNAQFALWPDPGLLDAAATLTGLPVILRTELNHHGMINLTVDFSDNHSFPPGDPSAALDEGSHHRLLRLEWRDRWEGQRLYSNRLYALESYDEFYAEPFGAFHPTRQGVPHSYFYEIVNEPDPWIAEMLEESGSGIFPPSGQPTLMSERARRLNPSLKETGRFFPQPRRRKRPASTPSTSEHRPRSSSMQPRLNSGYTGSSSA